MPRYELNLRDYWQIIQKRQFVLLVVFFSVFILTIFYTHTQRPVYQATASVQWIERQTLGGMLTELVNVNPADPLATQARIVTSLPVLERAVIELGLVKPKASPTEIIEQAVALQGAVAAEVVTATNIIQIIVTHEDPRLAAELANEVADAYVSENLNEKTKESRATRQFIEKQLEEINTKLKSSEESLAKFQESEAPSGVAVSLQTRLAELEAQRQNLLQKYTALHPDIKNIDEQIEQLKERLKTMPQKELEYSRLTREVEININLYKQLKDKLEAARISEAEKIGDASVVDRATLPGSPVSPNKPLNYFFGAVIGLMLGLAGAFTIEQLDTSMGTIEDVEDFLKLAALGVIPYLKVKGEGKKNIIQRLWPKELKGEEKILNMRNQLIIHYSSSSPIAEAYRILRTNIQREIFKEKIQGRILLVSSSGPEEGKSITTSNLAVAMAQNNVRTLLIDADMRRATIHKVFGLQKREPGLCDILRGAAQFETAHRTITDILMGQLGFDEAIKSPGLDNLNIITAGSLPTFPAELLSSPEMAQLLENLKNKFDLILIDTPPVLAVTDAAILAPKADGVILVYRVGKTARSIISRAKAQLTEAGAQVKGIVLNNISPEIEMRYGYYYHYKYYGKYYGEKKEGA